MKFFFAAPLLLSLASAAALAPREEKITYDGFRVYRIATGDNLASVKDQLSGFSLQSWNLDVSKHMDFALSPDQIEKFEALGLDATVMHQDLGADIAAEYDAKAPSGKFENHAVYKC